MYMYSHAISDTYHSHETSHTHTYHSHEISHTHSPRTGGQPPPPPAHPLLSRTAGHHYPTTTESCDTQHQRHDTRGQGGLCCCWYCVVGAWLVNALVVNAWSVHTIYKSCTLQYTAHFTRHKHHTLTDNHSIITNTPSHSPHYKHTLTHTQIIEDAALHDQYCRVITPEPALNEEQEDVCAQLRDAFELRYVILLVLCMSVVYECCV